MEIPYAAGGLVVGLLIGLAVSLLKKPAAAPKFEPPAPAPPKPELPKGAPLRLLALLQAESRLVDFLMEDIAGASDAQVGLAVKDIHRKAQATLKQHLTLEPVMAGNEGDTVSVPTGFDPSAIRVLGNVAGSPPYSGQLQHTGWRVKELRVNPPPQGADEFVLQPAEVQIG